MNTQGVERFLGLDIGSITGKAVLLNFHDSSPSDIQDTLVMRAGYNRKKTTHDLMNLILEKNNLNRSQIAGICTTGYGRKAVEFANDSFTEISCHGRGAKFLNPQTDRVIDIGGQDCKGISLNSGGGVIDFVMNDKCAAGTGRFLEVMAHALDTDLDSFGTLHRRADKELKISSTCTVFAESEVITLLSAGEKKENIIAAINHSVAMRIGTMLTPLTPGSSY